MTKVKKKGAAVAALDAARRQITDLQARLIGAQTQVETVRQWLEPLAAEPFCHRAPIMYACHRCTAIRLIRGALRAGRIS